MTIPVNLDGVEAWSGGGMLPEGRYLCRIEDATEGRSSGGYPQIELNLTVIEGDYSGFTTRDWVVVTEGSLGRVRSLLEAAGVEIPEGQFDLNPRALVNQHVEIVVRHEQYDNKPRSRVKAYNPPEQSDVPAGPSPVAAGAGSKDDSIPF